MVLMCVFADLVGADLMGVIMIAMIMAVFVAIKGQRAMGSVAKKCAVFRGRGHMFGGAVATDMAIEANHPVRGRHDDVQFVADHQNGTALVAAHRFDLGVKIRRSRLIKPLRGLVQDQQIGF